MSLQFLLPKLHYDIVRDDSRFKVIDAGRRFGKSQLLIGELMRNLGKVFQQGDRVLPHRIWYVAPTYKQGKEIFWGRAKEVFRPIAAKINESELSIAFVNGGVFAIKGSDNPDSLRGAYLTCLLGDEAAFWKPGVWQTILRPMLADVHGDATFCSSPDGFNDFYDLFNKGLEGELQEPGWRSWQYASTQGGFINQDEVDAAKADMTPEQHRQEFYGEFVAQAGRIYYNFDREKHCKSVSFVPGLDIHWFWDFNVNPCVHSGLAHIHKGRVYVFDEICIGETPDTVSEFIKRYPLDKLVDPDTGAVSKIKIYGDFSGSISTSGITDYQAMEQALRREGYPVPEIKVYGGNPIVRDRTNCVNAKLLNADGFVGLYLDPKKCPKLLRDLEQVKRSEKTGQIDKTSNPTLSHISDGLGYCLFVEFPPKWSAKAPAPPEIRRIDEITGMWV